MIGSIERALSLSKLANLPRQLPIPQPIHTETKENKNEKPLCDWRGVRHRALFHEGVPDWMASGDLFALGKVGHTLARVEKTRVVFLRTRPVTLIEIEEEYYEKEDDTRAHRLYIFLINAL